MADGSEANGTIVWNEIAEDVYSTVGDYVIKGTLTFAGMELIEVTARLHVIGNVIAMRNVSAVTTPNTVPKLQDKVSGVLADATLSGEFSVKWDSMTEAQFTNVGDVAVINGTATVMGTTTLPVTASVRVAEAVNAESENIAAQADSLTEDCAATSDNLQTLRDGETEYNDNTGYRWTNWNNRYTKDTAAITFTWATAHQLSGLNLYFFTDNQSASLPKNVRIEYSLNGRDFAEITYKDVTPTAGFEKTEYVFAEVINPVAVRIVLTQQGGITDGKCVGLTECEVMTYAGKVEANTSAALSVLGTETENVILEDGKYDYTISGATVQAASEKNAGITILPELDGIVRILTISEDGSDTRVYKVIVDSTPVCRHENTEMKNQKDATYTEEGYTGDKVCTKCGEIIEKGTVIPKLESVPGEKTAPKIALDVKKGTTAPKVRLTGKFEDYENLNKYYEVTGHGFVYVQSAKLGTRNLTVDYAGRTRVNVKSFKEDGSFSYEMTPSGTGVKYTVRAFLIYMNDKGQTKYVYTNPVTYIYNTAK